MIIEFKTSVNTNGNAHYMQIDTETRTIVENAFCPNGYKLSTKDFKQLKEQYKKDGYKSLLKF